MNYTGERSPNTTCPAPSSRAFTRLDLMALILLIGGLAVLSRPVWGGGQMKSQSTLCLSNFKRLIDAWQMYAADNSGRLVMVIHGSQAMGGAAASDARNAPWALGWLDWTSSRDNTNTLFLTEDKYAKLGGYLKRSAEVFKCPADQYLSPLQHSRGWTGRVRTVSGNVGLGGGNATSGPWDPTYKQIRTMSDFLFPGPSETWVFLEEQPNSQNDPAFFNPSASNWIDQPGSFHGNGTTLAFADGHGEIHSWRASLAAPAARKVKIGIFTAPRARSGDADIHWLSYRGGRASEKSY